MRLYRAKGEGSDKESFTDWQCVAVTLTDWKIFIQSLEQSPESGNPDSVDGQLYSYITKDLFSSIKAALEVKG